MYHTIFFDLDNTIYPADCGLWEAIGSRINSFITDVVGLDAEKVPEIRRYCRDNFGTTLQGLKNLYDIDEDQYLIYVHNVDLSKYLAKGDQLKTLFCTIPQRKIIFTNADERHARRVLKFLGVEEFFNLIIDVHKLKPFIKPQRESFLEAMRWAEIESNNGCVFVDDYLPNILSAEEMGFFSILVKKNSKKEYANQIEDIYDLPKLIGQASQ